MEAIKSKLKKEEEIVCALSQGTLYCVNGEQAVKDLDQVHETLCSSVRTIAPAPTSENRIRR
jgi:hypothetical protein